MNTQGIRYSGSKKDIIPQIIDLAKELDVKRVLDGFAGTTRVGQAFKMSGYDVDSNDLSIYSKVFGDCYLVNNRPESDFVDKIEHLNNLVGYDGWFTENYGGVIMPINSESAIQLDGKKKPWQTHNTRKLDAIRDEIDRISSDDIEKAVLLTSLILAMDKVDNTLGHQVSYLKKWSDRSGLTMKMEVPELISGNGNYRTLKQDVLTVDGKYDLVYLDPPYGTNNEKTKTTRVRYASYYHLWTTVINNDRPQLFGASMRREDVSSDTKPGAISVFESTNYEKVRNSIHDLISNIDSKYFMFSYNNKSKVKIDDLVDMFSKDFNLIKTISFKHRENVQKILTGNKEWMGDSGENLEYLFLIGK